MSFEPFFMEGDFFCGRPAQMFTWKRIGFGLAFVVKEAWPYGKL
jgi:hypothetical protein